MGGSAMVGLAEWSIDRDFFILIRTMINSYNNYIFAHSSLHYIISKQLQENCVGIGHLNGYYS